MPTVGFEITMPASMLLQTHSLDRAAKGNTFDHGEKSKITQSLYNSGQTLDTGRLYSQKLFLVLISERGSFDPRFIMKPEGIMSMKYSSDTIGIRARDL